MCDVKVISITELHLSDAWEDSKDQLKAYCWVNNAHYYAAPAESFCLDTAIHQAKAGGYTSVVVENLS